jgi:hypothetical protein
VFGQGGIGGGQRGGGMPGGAAGAVGRPSGRGTATDADIPQGRPRDIGKASVDEFRKTQPQGQAAGGPGGGGARGGMTGPARFRTIINFTRDAKDLLISGGLDGGAELAGAPALVDVPIGTGHVVMFSFNPMWRHETQGSYSLVFNAMLNYKNLSPAPAPAAPAPPAK